MAGAAVHASLGVRAGHRVLAREAVADLDALEVQGAREVRDDDLVLVVLAGGDLLRDELLDEEGAGGLRARRERHVGALHSGGDRVEAGDVALAATLKAGDPRLEAVVRVDRGEVRVRVALAGATRHGRGGDAGGAQHEEGTREAAETHSVKNLCGSMGESGSPWVSTARVRQKRSSRHPRGLPAIPRPHFDPLPSPVPAPDVSQHLESAHLRGNCAVPSVRGQAARGAVRGGAEGHSGECSPPSGTRRAGWTGATGGPPARGGAVDGSPSKPLESVFQQLASPGIPTC